MDNEIIWLIIICFYIVVALFFGLLYLIENIGKKIIRRDLILTSLLWLPILIFETFKLIRKWVK